MNVPLKYLLIITQRTSLKGKRLSADMSQGDNFWDIPFAFLYTKPLLKWVYNKRKDFAPSQCS